MKIALISDLHLLTQKPINRVDNILETQWDKLKFVLDYCVKNDIKTLIQAGDFFDSPRNWETLSKTINLLLPYQSKITICCVEGQHDKYMRNTESITNMQILNKLRLIYLPSRNKRIQFDSYKDEIRIYGLNFEDGMNVHKSIDALKVNPNKLNILVIHANISDAPLYPEHEFSNAKILLKSHPEFKIILCGDIHKEFHCAASNRYIVNSGSMIRKEMNEYNKNHIPCFFVWDSSSGIHKINIPCEPFNTVFDLAYTPAPVEEILTDFVNFINNPVQHEMDVYKKINQFIADNKISKEIATIIEGVTNG